MNQWQSRAVHQDPAGGVGGVLDGLSDLNRTEPWLPRYLAIYNGRRCHMALAGRTPFSSSGCWGLLNDLLRKHILVIYLSTWLVQNLEQALLRFFV